VGRARPIYEVVGLVRDTKYYDLRDEFAPEVFDSQQPGYS